MWVVLIKNMNTKHRENVNNDTELFKIIVFGQVSLPALCRAWTRSKYSFTLSWIPSILDPAMPAYIRACAASCCKHKENKQS